MRFNAEFVSTQIGQVGTQFDGLGHVGTIVEMADGDRSSCVLQWLHSRRDV